MRQNAHKQELSYNSKKKKCKRRSSLLILLSLYVFFYAKPLCSNNNLFRMNLIHSFMRINSIEKKKNKRRRIIKKKIIEKVKAVKLKTNIYLLVPSLAYCSLIFYSFSVRWRAIAKRFIMNKRRKESNEYKELCRQGFKNSTKI